ncbi:hypothetical protein [Vibrio phage VCPH]|nr:hypothetical protein [Vibrio phage VCPH]
MELMTAMPIGMLESLVLTVTYAPDYQNRSLAEEVPPAETVCIPQLYVEEFLEAAQFRFNLEEYCEPEEDSKFDEFVVDYEGWCPQLVNAMYVDMMGKLVVVDMECRSQYPSAFDRQ